MYTGMYTILMYFSCLMITKATVHRERLWAFANTVKLRQSKFLLAL